MDDHHSEDLCEAAHMEVMMIDMVEAKEVLAATDVKKIPKAEVQKEDPMTEDRVKDSVVKTDNPVRTAAQDLTEDLEDKFF